MEVIGFEQQKLSTEGGTANYIIEIVEAGDNSYRAIATSVVDFDQDGVYSVWEIDQNKKLSETTKD